MSGLYSKRAGAHERRERTRSAMTGFINAFNMFLFFLFSLCYMYQVVYAA